MSSRSRKQHGVLVIAMAMLLAWPAVTFCEVPGAEARSSTASSSRHRKPLATDQFKNGPAIRAAFRDVVQLAAASTVRILCDDEEAALGTIVGADGWIITKASELKDNITCKLPDGRKLEARIVGVAEEHDLAMLKIEATNLPVIAWPTDTSLRLGQWVLTPGMQDDPVAVGVLSVQPRKLPPAYGVMGVVLSRPEGIILVVYEGSGAEKAGVKVGDVITSINDTPTEGDQEVITNLRQYQPGDVVELVIRRGDQTVSVTVTLGRREVILGEENFSPSDFQNRMGSQLSLRRSGFPTVLQHDSVLRPADCGGPLVTIDGRVIGINIARGGRIHSYSIPADVVQSLLDDLKSGQLAP